VTARAAAAACLALLLLGLGGCGEKKEQLGPGKPEPFDLLLDYFPNADHAGIYAAKAGGQFGDVGLDVRIRKPADPAAPLKQVAAGRVDLAISYEPELLRARDSGLKLISVGALVQRPLTSIISLPAARISRPADLQGKRVGTAGLDYQQAYLDTIMRRAGANPASAKVRNLGFNLVPGLLTRKVDAVLGAYWNYEGVDLRLRRRDPRIIRIEQAGVPPYDELVLVANEDSLDRDSGRIKRFIGALARGTAAVERAPDQAIGGLLSANRDLDPKLQKAALHATLPTFESPRGKPYGWQDPREWAAFVRWMRANRLVKTLTSANGAFSNDLLPATGP
jgi:putative hydroxymethylpyrimidine transport system substrate-binding protein